MPRMRTAMFPVRSPGSCSAVPAVWNGWFCNVKATLDVRLQGRPRGGAWSLSQSCSMNPPPPTHTHPADWSHFSCTNLGLAAE